MNGGRSLDGASFIIVSYNSREFLERCLRSIAEHAPAPHEVLVVDNASSDGTVSELRPLWPGVSWICNSRNVGFGRACNQALRRSRFPVWVLLNPDAEVRAGCVPALLSHLRENPRVGVVGPRVLDAAGRAEPSAGWIPSPGRDLCELFLLPRLGFPGRRLRHVAGAGARPVDWVSGCCMAVRAGATEGVGLFDEHYFMYVEDMDWCHRFRVAGWEVHYLPGARVVHVRGASVLDSSDVLVDGGDGVEYFVRKHGIRYPPGLLRGIQVASLASRGAWHALRGVTGQPRARSLAAMYGRSLARLLRRDSGSGASGPR